MKVEHVKWEGKIDKLDENLNQLIIGFTMRSRRIETSSRTTFMR